MVFQSFNLWFHLTVLENVVEAPIYVQKRPKKEVIAEAEEGPPEKVLGFAGLSVAKEWKKVRVATEGAYPSWNATDPSGKLYGFDIDVINEVCKRSGLECEITAHAWKGIIHYGFHQLIEQKRKPRKI